MTFFAGNSRVLSLQVVARQTVIVLILRGFPVHQIEIFAVMLQVAADAIFSVRIPHLDLEVIAMLTGEPSGDFLVAIQALESWSAGAELVAARALGGSGQTLMGFRKRAGRDLRAGKRAGQDGKNETGQAETGSPQNHIR